jgi:hypothetical protein
MAEDNTMKELGRTIREQEESLDPRLDLLAEGELSSQETDQLREDLEDHPEIYAAFEPMGPDMEARLIQLALCGLSEEDEVNGEDESSNVVPMPPRRWSRRIWAPTIIAIVATAAVLALAPQQEALPRFDYAVVATDSDQRSLNDTSHQFKVRDDSLISIQLRPNEPVHGAMEAALFVRVEGVVHRSPVKPEVSDSGSVRIRGKATEVLGVSSGLVDVALVVCRVGLMPSEDEIFHEGIMGGERVFEGNTDPERVFEGNTDPERVFEGNTDPERVFEGNTDPERVSHEDPDPHCWRARYWTIEVTPDSAIDLE